MTGIQNEPNKHNGFAFTQFLSVRQRNYVFQLHPARWRFAFGNRSFVVAGITQGGESLQGYGDEACCRRAEIILQGILLIVRRPLETTSVAAQEIDPLWLVGEGPELHRQRLAASLELQLLSNAD